MRMIDRLKCAWHTLTDRDDADLLLSGPLPLWMRTAFEKEAHLQNKDVGEIIFDALRGRARSLVILQGEKRADDD